MAAIRSHDVSKIQDEDVLRRMWQETEDFGRKKEIRAHMYKIREARLRDFYSSGEVCKDIQRTNSSPGLREQRKGAETTHHTDSLLDHSFLSLKSKEIRDSESPTRDITFKSTDKGWTIKESNERSQDGKTHTLNRTATTSGSHKLDGGVSNYAAKNEQSASVFQDGDDKNFTKSVGASSKSVIKQEAHGGDENSKFYSTSTSSKSSSKFVSEQKSSTGDIDIRPVDKEIVTRTYTSNIPEELKRHPNYVDGKTKVYTETKTLPDGSTVTTTRYETTGGKTSMQKSSSSYSTSSKQVSSSEQKSSTSQQQTSSSIIKDSTNVDDVDNARIIKYSHPEIDIHYDERRKVIRNEVRDQKDTRNEQISRQEQIRRQEEVSRQEQINRKEQTSRQETQRSDRIEKHDLQSRREENIDVRQLDSQTKQHITSDETTRVDKRQYTDDIRAVDNVQKNREEIIVIKKPTTEFTHKTTATKTIIDSKQDDSKLVSNDFINIEKQHIIDTNKVERSRSPSKEPARQQKEKVPYEQPERRQPFKPAKSEMETKSQPTDGQYDTTYRSEFTNKRISVDISPTHDAFARSLRSVTPERDRTNTRGSIRSLRTSTTSLRSSTSPEKNRHPSRVSPDRRASSPRKKSTSPDKYAALYGKQFPSERPASPRKHSSSPDKYDTAARSTCTDVTRKQRLDTYNTDTITRRRNVSKETNINSSTLTRRSSKKAISPSRSSSPTDTVSDFEFKTRHEIVTDLDADDTTIFTKRPTNLEFTSTTKKTRKVTERSPTSPLSEARRHSPSPTKERAPRRSSLKATKSPLDSPNKPKEDFKPFVAKPDKVLRRTDTYEERCRQILGISEKKKVEKNISEILFTDRTRPKSPEKKSPRKPSLPDAARRCSSPEKTKPDRKEPSNIQEFPSQIRRSPERKMQEPFPQRTSPTKEASKLQEFPSQRKSSTAESPFTRTSPKKDTTVTEIRAQTVSESACKLQEFPSQIRKTPEREYSHPTKNNPEYDVHSSSDISQLNITTDAKEVTSVMSTSHKITDITRQTPERELQEFPSQVRKTPDHTTPERRTSEKEMHYTSLQDISDTIETTSTRRSPNRETPERKPSTIREFPSQIRRTPEREPLVEVPKKSKPLSEAPQTSEFPAQKRKSLSQPTPEDEVIEKTIKYLEGHIEPIDEPMFVKKFITRLGSDDEEDVVPKTRQSPERPSPVRRTEVPDDIKQMPKKSSIKNTQRTTISENTSQKTRKDDYYIDEKINLEIKKSPERLSPMRGIPDTEDKPKKTVKKDLSQTSKKQISSDFIRNEKKIFVSQNDAKPKTQVPKSKQPIRNSTEFTSSHDKRTTERSVISKTPQRQVRPVTEIRLISKPSQERLESVIKVKEVRTNLSETKIQNGHINLGLKPSQPKTTNFVQRKPTYAKNDIPDKKNKPDTKVFNRTPSNKEFKSKVEYNINKTSTTETRTCKKSSEPTPKRAVVSTIINLSPKTPTSIPKSITKKNVTVTSVKTSKIQRERTPKPTQPEHNGHISTDMEDVEVVENSSKSTHYKPPVRIAPKDKPKQKCITTKSITINNPVADQREIIVDLLRSKSSREDSPEKVWPVSTETEEDSGIPRYPDQILEPEEAQRRQKTKITDISLDENEDVNEFSRITELVDTKITEVDRVQETDDCLLTVNEKVSKFLNTADKLTKPKSKKLGPAPKVERPVLVVDEELESDECLLSVTDKVNKFKTTAEKLTVDNIPDRPKSPRCLNFEDDEEITIRVSDKVSHFTTSTEEDLPKPKSVAPKVARPDLSTVDDTLRTDECLLSVSDKVSKFITTAENLTVTKTDKSHSKNVETPQPTKREKSLEKDTISTDCPTIIDDEDMDKPTMVTPKNINAAPIKEKPEKRINLIEPDSTPKSAKRPSQEEKVLLSNVGRLRSTESIKKARALFENAQKEERPKQRDILTRPSVFEARRTAKKDDVKLTDIGIQKKQLEDVKRKLDYDQRDIRITEDVRRSQSPKRVPEIITPADDSDVPGYMRQLDRSLRPKSPHKDSVLELEQIAKGHITQEETVKQTKFGVVLKRTDSEKMERRRSSTTVSIEIDGVKQEKEIEDIYDLEILLVMMEKAVGYEIRRRIRAQIRIVKKLISENKLHTVTTTTKHRTSPIRQVLNTSRAPSPEKKTSIPEKHHTEYQTKYTRKSSQDRKSIDSNMYKHSDLIAEKDTSEKITEYESSYSCSRRSSETKTSSRKSSLRESPLRATPLDTNRRRSPEKSTRPEQTDFKPFRKTPERNVKPESKVFNAELRRTKTTSKQQVLNDEPEWVTQRNLKKITERTAPVTKKVTTSSSTVSSTSKKEIKRTSPSKDMKPTDVITSSYGVGPTDENGSPLFGLRALRANKENKTKVQGTVMHSSFYSENGQEPVGEISVTHYSTDPKDLGPSDDVTHKDGLLSKTTTQKFGYKNSPPYKTLTDKKRQTEKNDELRTSSTTTTKVTRRGSVKEMSQKFLDNAVETLKSERQSSYPKAGLILRSSSFKDASSGSSREGSPPAGSEEIHRSVTVQESRSKTSTSGKAESFLTNTSKVSGVQDVITRMKTEEYREGDSAEDVEARSLLNKFLGTQVILAGIEGGSLKTGATSSSTASASTSSTSSKRTTKVTSTVTENGSPKTTTRTFTHPITLDVLETVWDEHTLRLLLEQSSEYEERRIIRARLKEVMAEREACSEFVEKTLEETQAGNVQEKVETTRKTFSDGPLSRTQVTTTRVTSQQQTTKKPMSPFAKFRQLDKQNSLNTPPSTPKTPTSGGPLFKFTDPNLSRSASTIKERLLQWCQMKTKEYENIKLDNFSASWADGLAFCALIHHFLPDAFDYHQLTPNNRKYNFTLAFQVAEEKADIFPLLDVEDMVATRRPDWKCVFTYVQSIYRRFKDED